MTYEEILAVLDKHQYTKVASQSANGRSYDCECGERFRWDFNRPSTGHAEHLAQKLAEAQV
jgi:hypothetical protein